MPLTSERAFTVSLSIGGVPIREPFDSFEGGEVASESESYSAGGMAAPESSVNPPTTSEITISRAYRGERDAGIEAYIAARIGHPCVVSKQALNPDRSPVTRGLVTYRGKITGVSTPTHDSMGTSVTRFTVTIAVDGLPA